MKVLANVLAIIGVLLFLYTIVGRFAGDASILGIGPINQITANGFTAVGMFSGIACILLISVILLLNAKK